MRQTRQTPREKLARMLSEKVSALVGKPVVFRADKVTSTHSSQRRGMHDRYAWTAFGGLYAVDCYDTITACVSRGFTVHRDARRGAAQFDAYANEAGKGGSR